MRAHIQSLPGSKIREVANAALGRSDVLAFWFGEGDEVTPAFITEAAVQSLRSGETFYTHNLGLPELRTAIALEMTRRHRTAVASDPINADRIAVTSGGVNALMLAAQALIDPGARVVAVTPVWPNLTAQPWIMGAQLHCVSLTPSAGAWELDMDQLLDAITGQTQVLIVNAPNNPTGWTLSVDEQRILLEHCRRTGTWIVADEVYESLYYEPTVNGCAPSFLDQAAPDDRLVVVQSFSKSFLMTGYRLGWLVLPTAMSASIGNLIEFNTSCASVFTQRAGLAALARADEVTPRVVAHLKLCRDTLVDALLPIDGIELARPRGGMYAFFHLPGHPDSLQTAKRLVAEAGLGLAPGEAFSPQALGWLRWCFSSQDPARLLDGVERLRGWLARSL